MTRTLTTLLKFPIVDDLQDLLDQMDIDAGITPEPRGTVPPLGTNKPQTLKASPRPLQVAYKLVGGDEPNVFSLLHLPAYLKKPKGAAEKPATSLTDEEIEMAELMALMDAPNAPCTDVLNEKFAWIEANASIFRLEYADFIEPSKFKLQHDNRKISIKSGDTTKLVGMGTAWLTSEARRQHRALVIRPAEGTITKDNCLNEWRGYAVAPIQGNIEPFLNLLSRLVPDDEARRYVQKWMAHLIQHPDNKMFVSLVFWSHAQGVGKNLLFETFVSLIGNIHAAVIGQAELCSDFNGWSNRRIFIIGDEVSGSDKRSETDKLKGLITGTTNRINEKYQPAREVPNLMNFVFLSNHHDSLFLNDGDRRFLVWEIQSGQLPQSLAKDYVSWRDNGGLSALHHFLLNFDISDFNPKAPAPMTEAKLQLIADNRSDLESWVADLMASDIPKLLGRELATANELGRRYEMETGHKAPSSKAIVGAFKRMGSYSRPTQVRLANGTRIRPFTLMRAEYWKQQPDADWSIEMTKPFGKI